MDDTSAAPAASRLPGRMTSRLAAVTLVAQALAVFFGALVAWQLDRAQGGDSGLRNLLVVGGVALLCLVTAGLVRTRVGLVLGWACQVLTLASALLLPAMAVVGVLFGVLWWASLRAGRTIDAAGSTGAGAAYPDQADPTPDPES